MQCASLGHHIAEILHNGHAITSYLAASGTMVASPPLLSLIHVGSIQKYSVGATGALLFIGVRSIQVHGRENMVCDDGLGGGRGGIRGRGPEPSGVCKGRIQRVRGHRARARIGERFLPDIHLDRGGRARQELCCGDQDAFGRRVQTAEAEDQEIRRGGRSSGTLYPW